MTTSLLSVTSCTGIKPRSRCNSASSISRSPSRHDLKSKETIYDGENYRWILECLDGGKFS